MNPAFAMLTAAVLGIDVSWQPLNEGGVEYIIQIEPDQVDRMVKFDDLVSEVPKGLDVRRYRITIGSETLPKPTASAKSVLKESAVGKTKNPTREVIAEGAIPAPAAGTAAAAEGQEKTVASSDVADPKPAKLPESSPALPSEPADGEGPILPPTETTVQKPPSGTIGERDPAPQDEEGGPRSVSRFDDRPAASADKTDALFRSPATRPMKSRLMEEPSDETSTELPARSNRYAADEADERPALSTALRAAKADSRSSGSLLGGKDGPAESSWIVAIFFALLLSAGLNMYLFWLAHEARVRYQSLLEKHRAAGGKLAVDVA